MFWNWTSNTRDWAHSPCRPNLTSPTTVLNVALRMKRVVYQMPQVREAAVIGLPDEKWGERPVVVAALNAGHSLDYETLAKHCRAHLAGFKVPKQLILREQLPRNPSGKVLKRLLRDELK